jgi:uncharacterized protein YbjT (DUF2867 family)
MSMTQYISIIGANSGLGRELIAELIRLDKKILASDFCEAPEWLQVFPKESYSWLTLDLKKTEIIEELVKPADCLFFLPHQSLTTQHIQSKLEINSLMFLSYWISHYALQFKLSKVIYLSAMLNKELPKTSLLYNRYEIENILKESQCPIISVRIPLLLMDNTEPFDVIRSLIKTFPFTIFPTWIEKQVQPVFWGDVNEILIQLLLDNSYTKIHRNINLPGPDLISYKMLFKLIIRKMKLRRQIFLSNILPMSITAFFQSLFLKYTKRELENCYLSWNQDAVALTSDWKQKKSWVSTEDALKIVLSKPMAPLKAQVKFQSDSSVLVLRTAPVASLGAKELALEFFYWLENYFFSVVRIEIKDKIWRIYFPQKSILLLELDLKIESSDRVEFIFNLKSKDKNSQKVTLSINQYQLKSRKFAFICIKKDGGELSFVFKS